MQRHIEGRRSVVIRSHRTCRRVAPRSSLVSGASPLDCAQLAVKRVDTRGDVIDVRNEDIGTTAFIREGAVHNAAFRPPKDVRLLPLNFDALDPIVPIW